MTNPTHEFYLGRHPSNEAEQLLDPDKLTTHGVILGMTGSGKTGLGVVLLEEAARRRIPSLIIDPKGDMGNLLLNFATQPAQAFAPWVDPAEAKREGVTVAELGESKAQLWHKGVGSFGLDFAGDSSLALADRFSILTPGSQQGTPVNLIGNLACPAGASSAELLADEIDSIVSGLLGLLGEEVDPLTSRAYVFLSAIIRSAWEKGADLDLVELISQVLEPPFRKLGVFQLDAFFDDKARGKLAMQLNNLLASPSFAAWCSGEPLDMDRLLSNSEPHSTILYLAHLSEEERKFVVSLVLGKLLSWVRRQPGTSALRALLYMDEVAGYAPPNGAPSTKRPLLTLLKQARAQGLGLVLSTQNPVDLDYKALSNTGTWWLGRMQTEQDRKRVLSGMSEHSADLDELSSQIAQLKSRQFVLFSAKKGKPSLFGTRWALSYLRGPLTLSEVKRLCPQPSSAVTAAAAEEASQTPDASELPGLAIMPPVADSADVGYLRPSAEWAEEAGADFASKLYSPALVATVALRFDETKASLDHTEKWQAVFFPLKDDLIKSPMTEVSYDERDISASVPSGARYSERTPQLEKATVFRSFSARLKEQLHATETYDLLVHPGMKVFSRPGEARQGFVQRCTKLADDSADEAAAKLRDKYEKKLAQIQAKIDAAQQKAEQLEVDASARTQQEWISGAASVLGMFLGGGRNLRGLSGAMSRRGMTRRTKQRLKHAEAKVDTLEQQLEDIEQELAEELQDIADKFAAQAEQIEEFSVSLEKNDVRVESLRLVWIPTSN